MQLHTWAQHLLLGDTLADKLLWPDQLDDTEPGPVIATPDVPGRPVAWAFSPERLPFPSRGALADAHARGTMLHFFANHELLAIEIFALGLLRFPDAPRRFRQGIVATIRDEQRHLQLYLDRMAGLGVSPGAVPVNRFFWDCAADLSTPLDLCVRMGLVFEQANLDYCVEFGQVMDQVGDPETSAILDRVLADEIGHVQHGLHWFRRWKDPDQSDWDAFVAHLSLPLGPTRARGGRMHRDLRQRVGLDDDFIERLAVHGASKGRPPVVWCFNPDAEAEIGDPQHVASPKVAALERDLAALPWVLAKREDVVLVSTPPRVEWLRHLADAGLVLPEFAADVGPRKIGSLSPWGWSPRVRQRLAPLVARTIRPPPEPEPAAFRKDTAAGLLRQWRPEQAWLAGTVCTTWAQVQAAATETTAIKPVAVKPVLSTAGQGILREVEQAAVERLLATQPAVLVLPWLQREADLSMHFDIEGGRARPRGFTLFEADARGQWRRSLASRTELGLSKDLLRFLHSQHARGLPGLGAELSAFLTPHLAAVGVQGPVGVDMLVGRGPDGQRVLHPLLEINPRWTMGRVALALRPRIAPGTAAWLSLVREPQGALEAPRLDDAGRLQSGRLWLTDPQGAQVAAVLDVG